MQRFLTAALLSALVFPNASAQLHYLVTTTTSSNLTDPSPATSILFYDRATLAQLARLDFPTRTYPVAASPDYRSLYLADNSGIITLDVRTLTVTGTIPIPGLVSAQPAGPTHLLARTADHGILRIDPTAQTIAGPVYCPFPPEGLLFSGLTVYGYSSSNQNLCIIGPEFRVATSVNLGRNITSARVLDTPGFLTLLLLSTWDNVSGYDTIAVGAPLTPQTLPVPSLEGALPAFPSPTDPHVWYAIQHPTYLTNVLQRYTVKMTPDGPVFTPQLDNPPSIATVAAIDDRYVYTSVIGYCSTLEGPIEGCPYGFNVLDAVTLQPVNSLTIVPKLSYGYQGPQTLGLSLSVPYWRSPSRSPRVPNPEPRIPNPVN